MSNSDINSNSNIINFSKLNLNKIIYTTPKKTDNKSGYISYIYYNSGDKPDAEKIPLLIQTPKMNIKNPISINKNRCYIEFDLSDNKEFLNLIKKIDEKNVMLTTEYSDEWFGKQIPMNIIDDYYRTPLFENEENIHIKYRIHLDKKKCPDLQIYNNDNKLITYEEYNSLTDIKSVCIVQFIGLRFLKKQFIPEWKVVQIKAYNNKKDLPYMFCDEDNYNSDDEYLVPYLTDEENENTENIEDTENDETHDNNLDIDDLDSLLSKKQNKKNKELEEKKLLLNEAKLRVEELTKEIDTLEQ